MRKILISLIACLLFVGTIFFIVQGMQAINVQGIVGISEKNKEIDKSISDLSNVISVTYVGADANLRRTANTLTETKTEYENQAILSQSNSKGYASGKEAYDIDYLWTKLGNYAKEENVVIKIEVMTKDVSVNLYDLHFTVTGDYTNITNFIYDIENDSRLGFKIDAFAMTSVGDSESSDVKLNATFECREIFISVGGIDTSTGNVAPGKTNTGVQTDGVSVNVNQNQTQNQNMVNQNTVNQSVTNGVTKNTTNNNTTNSNSASSNTTVGAENLNDYSV